ncbi:MAG: hypothetical protein ACK52I_26620 [Pseudomonadota bacterium]|jgi:hypothetical protein
MSQMTNFKSEIAEALFDSSVKVSREALVWAMSNLPDGENKGSHTIGGKLAYDRNFDHSQENIWQAIGVSEKEGEHLGRVMTEQLAKIKDPEGRVSTVVEGVLDAIEKHPNLIKLIAVKTVQEALEFAQAASEMGDMAKMIKMMKMLGRMKGGDNEE